MKRKIRKISIDRDILIAQANRLQWIHDKILNLDTQKHRKKVKDDISAMRNISFLAVLWFNEIID